MFQDWSWHCHGCRRCIDPYVSHDMMACYEINGVKPYVSSPTTLVDKLFGCGLALFLLGIVAIMMR